MITLLRRVFWVAALGAGGVAGWSMWAARKPSGAPALAARPPEWPPIESPGWASSAPVPATDAAVTNRPLTGAPVDPAVSWVSSDGGSCPLSHPIKANTNSGIFHVPGGRFYEQTRAERCYAVPEDAEADGYRRSKS